MADLVAGESDRLAPTEGGVDHVARRAVVYHVVVTVAVERVLAAAAVFRAVGVAIPPSVQKIEE